MAARAVIERARQEETKVGRKLQKERVRQKPRGRTRELFREPKARGGRWGERREKKGRRDRQAGARERKQNAGLVEKESEQRPGGLGPGWDVVLSLFSLFWGVGGGSPPR